MLYPAWGNDIFPELAVDLGFSNNAALSQIFSLSASYSIMESTFDNLGLAVAYQIGNVQLYAESDNIPSLSRPSTARNMNLRVGINLVFQDEARQKKVFTTEMLQDLLPVVRFE